MRFHDDIEIDRPPGEVFAFMADPAKLGRWQRLKTHVTPLDEGPPRRGYRVREGNRVGIRSWEQTVEFTEFEPGRLLGVAVVDGPRSEGRWRLEPAGGGTRLSFEGTLPGPRALAPLLRPIARRQFRAHHRHLKRELEAG